MNYLYIGLTHYEHQNLVMKNSEISYDSLDKRDKID